MTEMFSNAALTAFLQVVMIDLVLAGDNAIVIGLAAAGLPKDQRNKAIVIGIVAATLLRIAFASVTVQLLQIIGLLLAGGVLLLWVCWKMWRELRTPSHDIDEALDGQDINADGTISNVRAGSVTPGSLRNAVQRTFATALTDPSCKTKAEGEKYEVEIPFLMRLD